MPLNSTTWVRTKTLKVSQRKFGRSNLIAGFCLTPKTGYENLVEQHNTPLLKIYSSLVCLNV